MQALSEVLPKYSEKDFVIVYRKNKQGMFKSEIWTKRDFEPLEIMLAPYSSQIKDSHLTTSAHAPLTLPKTGRGCHPEDQSLALDGRCRNLMARKDLIDPEEHTGSLYWVVTRTSETKEQNLEFENFTWEQNIQVSMPSPVSKKRKLDPVHWSSSELPSFPVLLNKKALKKHTKLCVFMADKKKEKDLKGKR